MSSFKKFVLQQNLFPCQSCLQIFPSSCPLCLCGKSSSDSWRNDSSITNASSGASSTTQCPTSASRCTSARGQAPTNRSKQSGRKHQSCMPQIKQAGRSAKLGSPRSISASVCHVVASLRDADPRLGETRPRGVGISFTKPYTPRRFAHESYGARYPAATAGSSLLRRESVIRSAARLNRLPPCTANRPITGMRQAANSPGDVLRRKRAGVEQRDPLQPLGHPQHRAEADRAAPILGNERHAVEIELVDERSKISNVIIQRQKPRRLLAQSAADVVDCHAAKTLAERRQSDAANGTTTWDSRVRRASSGVIARCVPFVHDSASVPPARRPSAKQTDTVTAKRHRFQQFVPCPVLDTGCRIRDTG